VPERLLLVGMMASGKSTVARLVAKRLGWDWVDTDEEVVRDGGASIPDLFARHGESHFRAEERRALESVLGRPGPLVVSVGGGAVLDPANRASLRAAGTVVWLRARTDTLVSRVRDGGGRPLLVGQSPDERMATLRALDAARRPLYTEVADSIVDVDGHDLPAVVDRLLVTVGLATAGADSPGPPTPGRKAHP
jgi:shikimate kinase